MLCSTVYEFFWKPLMIWYLITCTIIIYRIFGNIRRYFFSPSHGYRLILLIRLILVFFLKKLGKNHVFKQNYEKKIWNISLITLGHFKHNRKRKTIFEIFLTKCQLIKCNFFHSYKLLTLFSLYINGSLTHVHR